MSGLTHALAELAELSGSELSPQAARVLVRVFNEMHDELDNQATRADVLDVKLAVGELTQAQLRTEQRLEQLAQAQQRTEQRLEQLAEAQQRTEQRLEQLAEAQQRTEQRLEQLAEAQQQTAQEVAGLAQAQQRTERELSELGRRTDLQLDKVGKEVAALTRSMRQMQQEHGGLSHVVGYRLEDEAYRGLPRLLRSGHDLEVVEPLSRVFLDVAGRRLQVNLWGLARRPDGRLVRLVGEGKSQLSARHLAPFAALLARTRPAWGADEALGVLVTYMAEPEVVAAAAARGWLVVHSFELLPPLT